MRHLSRSALSLLLLVVAACGDSTGPGPDPDPDPDPNSPDTMAVLGHGVVTSRFTAEVAVRGEWAYTTTWGNRGLPGNMMYVWNVAANAPVLTDSVSVAGASTLGDVQISDDGALLVVAKEYAPGSIVLFDRSNPSRPVSLGAFASANTTPGVHTVKLGRVNGRHYAFLSVNPSGTVPAKLVIVDITDPAQPTEVLSRAMGRPFVHDTYVRDGILFTALWHDGLSIWDIGGGGLGGTPADPVLISNYVPLAGYIHNIWWFHDPHANQKRYVFLGEEGPGSVGGGTASGDVHVIDVSNMAQPIQVARFYVTDAGAHNFSMDEQSGILYAAYYNGGVRAIDVRGDLSNCTATQRGLNNECNLRAMGREVGVGLMNQTLPFVWGVAYQNGRVYASDMRSGLFTLDASRFVR